MAVSTAEYNRILSRLNKAEETIADLLTIVNKCVTASTISRVVVPLEADLEALELRVVTLETQVQELLDDPYEEQED
jgi:tetrahydromethanopterin S-methyltransferase subunit G